MKKKLLKILIFLIAQKILIYRVIKKFKIFENNNMGEFYIFLKNFDDTDTYEFIYEIKKYSGFDDNKCKFQYSYGCDFELQIDERYFEGLVGLEEGVIGYFINLSSSYSSYEHYVDDDELNSISVYLSDDTKKELEKLIKYLEYDINIEEDGELKELFENLELDDLIDEIKTEISIVHENALEEHSKELMNNFPFEFSFGNKYDLLLSFNVEDILVYIEEHKLENIKTLKDFLIEIDYELSYDETYNYYDKLGDFKDLDLAIYNKINDFVLFPDALIKEFVLKDNLELFKKHIEDADFEYKYKLNINYNLKNYNLFEISKHLKGDILEYFKSYDFQKWFINENDSNRYKLLLKEEIINTKIKKEYSHLVEVDKFNL